MDRSRVFRNQGFGNQERIMDLIIIYSIIFVAILAAYPLKELWGALWRHLALRRLTPFRLLRHLIYPILLKWRGIRVTRLEGLVYLCCLIGNASTLFLLKGQLSRTAARGWYRDT